MKFEKGDIVRILNEDEWGERPVMSKAYLNSVKSFKIEGKKGIIKKELKLTSTKHKAYLVTFEMCYPIAIDRAIYDFMIADCAYADISIDQYFRMYGELFKEK